MGAKKNFAVGTVIAAAAGYVAGVLTAPKSGKDTRKDIKDAAVKTKTEAEKTLKKLHSEINDLIEKGKSTAQDLKATGKKDLEIAMDRAQKAKANARDILSALHEGDVSDKDLQKAIDEVKQAKEHLKAYLNKIQNA